MDSLVTGFLLIDAMSFVQAKYSMVYCGAYFGGREQPDMSGYREGIEQTSGEQSLTKGKAAEARANKCNFHSENSVRGSNECIGRSVQWVA